MLGNLIQESDLIENEIKRLDFLQYIYRDFKPQNLIKQWMMLRFRSITGKFFR